MAKPLFSIDYRITINKESRNQEFTLRGPTVGGGGGLEGLPGGSPPERFCKFEWSQILL